MVVLFADCVFFILVTDETIQISEARTMGTMILILLAGISWLVMGAMIFLMLFALIKIWAAVRHHKRYLRAARFAHEWYSMELGPEFDSDGEENKTEENSYE